MMLKVLFTGEGFETYPLYAASFLTQKPQKNIIDTVDVKKLKVRACESFSVNEIS
jgi:hypothetical protein